MKKLMLLLTFPTFMTGYFASAKIIYVKADASGSANTGNSWTDAYDDLQKALDNAQANDTIWVAKGTYYPNTIAGTSTDDRDKTFLLKDKVSLFGGFSGTETTLDERVLDPANASILSGNLGAANNDDNAYHVILAIGISEQTTLDGFTIKNGNANGTGDASIQSATINRNLGAGIFAHNSSLTFNNIILDSNSSSRGGAGINNEKSDVQLKNSSIQNNEIVGQDLSDIGGGAGMRNSGSSPALTNVRFENNNASAVQGGGGMRNINNSNPQLNHVAFTGNSLATGNEGDGGGAMYNLFSNPILQNITFTSNTTNGGGGGIYNDNSIPELSHVRFQENKAEVGGAMENDGGSHAILNYVVFEDNEATEDGGGMFNWKSNPILTNVIFERNKADGDGGAVHNYNEASPVMTHVVLKNNTAGKNGGGIYNLRNANPILTNVLIVENNAGEKGGGIYVASSNDAHSSPILTNVTIANNKAVTSGGGGYDDGKGKTKLRNSIITANTAASDEDIDAPPTMLLSAVNSIIIDDQFVLGGVNPPVTVTGSLFADATNGDYRLAMGSYAIDRGDKSLFDNSAIPDLSAITTDINGADRIMGTTIDLGAFEACTDTVAPNVSLDANPSTITENAVITFTATPDNGGLYPKYRWLKNSAVIPNVEGAEYTGIAGVDFIDGDTITVVLYSSLSCANYDSAVSELPLNFNVGISETKGQAHSLKVYPNPNNGNFNIKAALTTGKQYQLYITDILGRELYAESFTAQKSDLQKELALSNSLLPGIYFLTILDGGNMKQVARIVIQ